MVYHNHQNDLIQTNMNEKNIIVTKMSGDKEAFDESKMLRSLERSGADKTTIDQIIAEVKERLFESISTKEIYHIAFSLLRKKSRPVASRYKLKKAIMELGPTGFPFEKYVSELLKYDGFETQVGTITKGHCVSHEVDVIAEKKNEHYMVECKFHGIQGHFCDVKIPLYIQSRFKDVESIWKQQPGHEGKPHTCGLVTNTRFTTDALQYGKCMGMYMLSWDYPAQKSLSIQIYQKGLHPLTSLLTLSKAEKGILLNKGIVLCKSLIDDPDLLAKINIRQPRLQNILDEIKIICKPVNN